MLKKVKTFQQTYPSWSEVIASMELTMTAVKKEWNKGKKNTKIKKT